MLILGFLMQLLLAMSPSHSKWSKEEKKEIGKAQHTFSEESTVLNQDHPSLLSYQDSKFVWDKAFVKLNQGTESMLLIDRFFIVIQWINDLGEIRYREPCENIVR